MSWVFVMAHGWAGSSETLRPLANCLKEKVGQFLPQAVFLGLEQHYFKDAIPELLHLGPDEVDIDRLRNDAQTRWIGIGHSLGFAQLFKQPVQWSALISLHGFTRFTAHETGQAGTPVRLLDRMIKQFEANPHKVLQEFWHRSNHATPHYPGWLSHQLLNDLKWMRTLDFSNSLHRQLKQNRPLLAIYSDLDLIVPGALSKECFDLRINPDFQTPLKRVSLETSHEGFTHVSELYTSEITDFLRSTIGSE